MTSTPPPRGRLRTPPAPTHGPGYDAYSPYSGSPRRSKRLASKIESQHDQLEPQTPLSSDKNYQSDFHESPGSGSELQRTSLYSHHSLSASGSSNLQYISYQPQSCLSSDEKRHSVLNGNSPQLEPDSDDALIVPNSPAKQGTTRIPKPQHNTLLFYAKNHTNKVTKNTFNSLPSSHNSSGMSKQQPTMGAGMLPTPAKTPRKKNVENTKTVARTLFTKPAQTTDSSRRVKGKKYNGFSLESFHADPHQAASGSIEIFTDVRDRIPTLNTAEDNPFISHPAEFDKFSDDDQPLERVRRRKLSQVGEKRDPAIDDMISRDDGILYVFRGKKIFRKFKPDEATEAQDSDDAGILESVEEASENRSHRLTRSSIKPRILFPTAEQLRARAQKAKARSPIAGQTEDEAGEEEEPHQASRPVTPEATNAPLTPPSKITRLATPSTPLASGRSLRSHTKRAEPDLTPDNSGSPSGTHVSPFDSWTRTKPRSSSATQGKKRSSSTLGRSNLRQSKKVHQE